MKKSIGSGRGSVYNILLKALQTGDKYGYEICKEIEEKSNGAYILKQPSLYSGLKRLEAQNLITSYWRDSDLGGRRHYYSLTDAGRQKIESSNFTWEDTRDNLVNSLFEKSELQNDIDDVVNQVTELKQQAENANELQQDIDDVLSSTQTLAEEKQYEEVVNDNINEIEQDNITKSAEQNTENAKVDETEDLQEQQDLFAYGNSDDLFSMYRNFDAGQVSQQEVEDIKDEEISNDNDEDFLPLQDDVDAFAEEGENDASNLTQNPYALDKTDDENVEADNNEADFIEEIEELLDEELIDEDESTKAEQENEQQQFTSNQDSNQLDLFSFINTQQDNEQKTDEDSTIDETIDQEEIDEYDDIIKNFTTYQTQENNSQTHSAPQYQDNNDIEDQTDTMFEDQQFDKEDDLQDEQDNLDDYTEEMSKNGEDESADDLFGFYDNDFENDVTKQEDNYQLSNIESQNTEQKTEQLDEQTEITLQANENDYLSQYKNNKIASASFADNSKLETAEKSFFKENFSTQDFDLENTNFDFSNPVETKDDDQLLDNNANMQDFNLQNENNNTINAESEQNFDNFQEDFTEDNTSSQSSIDYVNIFGDLVSNKTNKNTSEQKVENNGFTQQEKHEEILDNKQSAPTDTYNDDLPRVSTSNNINRTFVVDQEMMQEINEHYYEENAFEKLDNKIKEDSYNQEQNAFEQYDNQQYNDNQQHTMQQPQRDLPFDKKYSNVFNHFEVPDYQVRYYKKPTSEKTKESKFISINKLNLISNIILCVLICIATIATLVCSSLKVDLNTTQIVYYVLSFVVAVSITAFHFLKYIANKNKKALELSKNEMIYDSFFAVVIIILTVALNILFGMNLTNILSYSATFILPLCYAALLFIQPLLKKFLSKFSSFYLN